MTVARVARSSIVFALSMTGAAANPPFEEWVSQYGVNGDDSMKAKYEKNCAEIDRLNAEDNGAEFAVNEFSGMSFEEFAAQFLTFIGPEQTPDLPMLENIGGQEAPSSIDWPVTPVKNQGYYCGSCWAFAAMAAIEANYKIQTGRVVDLAEQQLIDCEPSDSCDGGFAENAFQYLSQKAIYTTDSYPYEAEDGSCKSGADSGVRISGYRAVDQSDSAMASALSSATFAVHVNATSAWMSYSRGVLTTASPVCGRNHVVVATGYSPDYFKLKNSWGTGWGEEGFIRIKRTTSSCGPFGLFAMAGSMPVLTSNAIQV
jgi:hypothetical protein